MPQRIEFEGHVHEFPDDFTDADIAAALGEPMTPVASHERSVAPSLATPGVVAARAIRPAVVRAGEDVATSPALGRAVRGLSGPSTRMAVRAVGASSGSIPGYIAGEALTSPAITKAAEAGIRGVGTSVARVVGSGVVRSLTGLPGLLVSMVGEPGDRPVGETASTTTARQVEFRRQYDEQRRERRDAERQTLLRAMQRRGGP